MRGLTCAVDAEPIHFASAVATFLETLNMRRISAFLILASLAALSPAADRAAQQRKQRVEIQQLLDRMSAAENKGDASAVALCFESDGMLLPSSGEPVSGREGITSRYKAILSGRTPRLPLESEELWILDDWAVSRGATRAPGRKSDGPKGAVRNRYVMTLKRHGDAWEVHSLVWTGATAALK